MTWGEGRVALGLSMGSDVLPAASLMLQQERNTGIYT